MRISKAVFDQFTIDEADNQELLHKRQVAYYMASRLGGPAAAQPKDHSAETKVDSVTTAAIVRMGIKKYFDKAMPKANIEQLLKVGQNTDDSPIDDGICHLFHRKDTRTLAQLYNQLSAISPQDDSG